jgi:hypothetical protein
MSQLSKVVHMYSRNIQDASLPITIQTTSVRLLLNLVDNIFRNKEIIINNNNNNNNLLSSSSSMMNVPRGGAGGLGGKLLLLRILKTLVNKFDTIRDHLLLVEETEQLKKSESEFADVSTQVQLSEMIKTRSFISTEAKNSQQLLGSLGVEIEKNYYTVVGIDAHCEVGNFFFNGSPSAPKEAVAPRGGEKSGRKRGELLLLLLLFSLSFSYLFFLMITPYSLLSLP